MTTKQDKQAQAQAEALNEAQLARMLKPIFAAIDVAKEDSKALKEETASALETIKSAFQEWPSNRAASFAAAWLTAYKLQALEAIADKEARRVKIDNRRRAMETAFGKAFDGFTLALKATAGSKYAYSAHIGKVDKLAEAEKALANAARKYAEMVGREKALETAAAAMQSLSEALASFDFGEFADLV